jgi:hypothetical protein
MRLANLTVVHSDDRHCTHCERVTRWDTRAGYAHCSYCGREGPSESARSPDRASQRAPLRTVRSASRHVHRTLRTYPLLLVLLVMLAASFTLAAWLDAQAPETATSAQAETRTEVVETG